MLVIADTCRSESMYRSIVSPNVLATSSSLVEEDSLSHHVDRSIGVYVIDRYAYYAHKFLETKVTSRESNTTIDDYLHSCPKNLCISTTGIRTDLFERDTHKVRASDFFSSRKYVEPIENVYDFDSSEWTDLTPDFDASALWLQLGKDRHLEY
jgi:phosphatidylinositol glycan class K